MNFVKLPRAKHVSVAMTQATTGMDIVVEGYGVKGMELGTGSIIYLEIQNGKLMLYAWADINDEEPTHIIDLSGAKEA